jgi:hypothetical protein
LTRGSSRRSSSTTPPRAGSLSTTSPKPCVRVPLHIVLTDKTRIHLRSASVRTYTFFTTGFPRFLAIRGARGLLALNKVLI